jgi:hypothetical protein
VAGRVDVLVPVQARYRNRIFCSSPFITCLRLHCCAESSDCAPLPNIAARGSVKNMTLHNLKNQKGRIPTILTVP